MSRSRIPEFVTPRAESLVLRSPVDATREHTVKRGAPLRVTARRSDGHVEVEYGDEQWLAPLPALESWHAAVGGDSSLAISFREHRRRPIWGWLPRRLRGTAGALAVVLVATGVLVVALWLVRWRQSPIIEPERASELAPRATIEPPSRMTAETVPAAVRESTLPVLTPTASPLAPPAPTPPTISGLFVCDTTTDCRRSGAIEQREILVACLHVKRAGERGGLVCESWLRVPTNSPPPRIVACLSVTPGTDSTPLNLVATAREEPPTEVEGASVVARVSLVPQEPGLRCFSVQAVSGELAPGDYWLWVLHGSTSIGRTSFVLARPRG